MYHNDSCRSIAWECGTHIGRVACLSWMAGDDGNPYKKVKKNTTTMQGTWRTLTVHSLSLRNGRNPVGRPPFVPTRGNHYDKIEKTTKLISKKNKQTQVSERNEEFRQGPSRCNEETLNRREFRLRQQSLDINQMVL